MQGPITEILMPLEVRTDETRLRHFILIPIPLFNVMATHPNFLFILAAGTKHCLMEKWNAEEAVKILKKNALPFFLGVPTHSAELIEAGKKM